MISRNNKKIVIFISFMLMMAYTPFSSTSTSLLDLPFSRTFLNLFFGGKQRLERGLSRGVKPFFKDWKSHAGALETGSSLALDITSDVARVVSPELGSVVNALQPFCLVALNTGLAARMFLPGYQAYSFGKEGTISPWLIQDITTSLRIFGNLSEIQIAKVTIKPLNELGYDAWGRVCMLWLGIVPTQDTLYVDEEFLQQFRGDPLMYGFLLAHGIHHFKEKTFAHRTTVNLPQIAFKTAVGLKAFLMANNGVDRAVDASQAAIERKTPALAIWKNWNFLRLVGDESGDHQRGWTAYSALMAVRWGVFLSGWMLKAIIAESITEGVMGLYNKADMLVKKKLISMRSSLKPSALGSKMDQWLAYYQQCLKSVAITENEEQNLHLLPYTKSNNTLEIQQSYSYAQRIKYVQDVYIKPWLIQEEQSSDNNEFRANLFKNLMADMNRWYDKTKAYPARVNLQERVGA